VIEVGFSGSPLLSLVGPAGELIGALDPLAIRGRSVLREGVEQSLEFHRVLRGKV
jgi:hypothetical protein